jgi:putative transposase
MRFTPSILTSLLKGVDRRAFKTLVERHDGDRYDKRFSSWEHLVALVYAQLSGNASLRAVEAGFNAQSPHHYHLGCGKIARSTLSDANARRPPEMFAELFGALAAQLGRTAKRDAKETLRLIDSTPVPLSAMFDCVTTNGRIKGLKLHIVHDLDASCPEAFEITPANVNDIRFGREIAPEEGVTYVFDKAYCHFGWWTKINQAKAFFVTRPKANARWKTLKKRALGETEGDGFTITADREVKLASKGDSKLAIFLRRITVLRDNGESFELITNDKLRGARDIAYCYKARWQIELLFKWIKQTLNIKKFMALNENAVRLQIIAALIAFALLQIARQQTKIKLNQRRFVELVGTFLFARRHIGAIEKPPPINPSKAKPPNPDQMAFAYV